MREKHIGGWSDLTQLVDANKTENWLYRGVTRNDHTLIPKIGRRDARGRRLPFSVEQERLLLEEFKRQVRPMIQVPPETELEWMALGQHHGLKTRLLDWTESLLVAAFFATEHGVMIQNGKRHFPAIYGIRDLPAATRDVDPFNLGDVQVYRPSHISPRIAPQQAAFTIHPNPDQEFDNPAVVCWILEISGTVDVRLALDASGFTRASLFPGIDGLADALNWQHKWGRLRA